MMKLENRTKIKQVSLIRAIPDFRYWIIFLPSKFGEISNTSSFSFHSRIKAIKYLLYRRRTNLNPFRGQRSYSKSRYRQITILSANRYDYVKFTTVLTYSEITVATAAPPMPRSKRNIKIGSRNAFSKLPATAAQQKKFVKNYASKRTIISSCGQKIVFLCDGSRHHLTMNSGTSLTTSNSECFKSQSANDQQLA